VSTLAKTAGKSWHLNW